MQAELAATHPHQLEWYEFSEAYEQLTNFKIDSATEEREGGSFGPTLGLSVHDAGQAIEYRTTHA